jgi:hypothetical protein
MSLALVTIHPLPWAKELFASGIDQIPRQIRRWAGHIA